MEILEIQKQCMEDSERWFPGVAHNLPYMTIAITGELGEFCNILKKVERGSIVLTEESHTELAFELCDVFIYLCNMAAVMNVDLGKMYELKREFNEKRFGAGSSDSPSEHVGADDDDEVPDGATSFMPISKLSEPLQGRKGLQDPGQWSGGGSFDVV
jgi:NTP pyrophosphatase (non-canonical NTP hydrolase)